jgi:hypothetical protein
MQTRSEWFLGARGGSLELNSDQHLRPPSSTPLPELIGALGHGTMGTYNLLYDDDNLSEIVDVHNNNTINNASNSPNNTIIINNNYNNHINVNVNVNSPQPSSLPPRPSSSIAYPSDSTEHLHHRANAFLLNANNNNSSTISNYRRTRNTSNHSRLARSEMRSASSTRSHSGHLSRQSNLSIVVFHVLDFLF